MTVELCSRHRVRHQKKDGYYCAYTDTQATIDKVFGSVTDKKEEEKADG